MWTLPDLTSAIGWAVVHSTWQITLIALVLAALLAYLPAQNSRLRYTLSYAALVACIGWFLYTILHQFSANEQVYTAFAETVITDSGTGAMVGVTQLPDWWAGPELWLNQHIDWITWVWWVGMLGYAFYYGMAYRLAQRLRHRQTYAIPAEWQHTFVRWVQQSGVSVHTELRLSGRVSQPLTLGHFKPLILVPLGFFSQLSPAQVEAVVWHELAHIRRYDYLFHLVQTGLRAILFYHPLIHYICRQIDAERENACDDFAVGQTHDPRAFAQALHQLQLQFSFTPNPIPMQFSKNKNVILLRLQRLLQPEHLLAQQRKLRLLTPAILAAVCGLFLIFQYLTAEPALAHTNELPAFDLPTVNVIALAPERDSLDPTELAKQRAELEQLRAELARTREDAAADRAAAAELRAELEAMRALGQAERNKDRSSQELRAAQAELERSQMLLEREQVMAKAEQARALAREARAQNRQERREHARLEGKAKRAASQEHQDDMSLLLEELRAKLIADNLVNPDVTEIALTQEDGVLTVNGKQVPDNLANEYKSLLFRTGIYISANKSCSLKFTTNSHSINHHTNPIEEY